MTPEEFKAKYPLSYSLMLELVINACSLQHAVQGLIDKSERDYSPEKLARIEAAVASAGTMGTTRLIKEVIAEHDTTNPLTTRS